MKLLLDLPTFRRTYANANARAIIKYLGIAMFARALDLKFCCTK
jgi:hypothetical protein